MSYVRFQLPRVHPSYSGQMDSLTRNMQHINLEWIERHLTSWASEYHVEYTVHLREDALYVEFATNSSISLFALSWQPKAHDTVLQRTSIVDTIPYYTLPSNDKANAQTHGKRYYPSDDQE
jgi:hypothetical protein